MINNKITSCDNSLKVRIAAFQAVGPGSIPGCRIFFFFKMLIHYFLDLIKNKILLTLIIIDLSIKAKFIEVNILIIIKIAKLLISKMLYDKFNEKINYNNFDKSFLLCFIFILFFYNNFIEINN